MYIKLREICNYLNIHKGDKVFVSSDIRRLMCSALRNNEDMNINEIIDGIISVIGSEGTLIIPTYNWDFCRNITFDYIKTPSKTGSIGNAALSRSDFKRSLHPIYSFAVFGKDQKKICSMNNISSFGTDSPFEYFKIENVKNIVIDVPLDSCFTFAHYVEEKCLPYVSYRYLKTFTAGYIDYDGVESERSYSMLVRKLEINTKNIFAKELEQRFKDLNCEKEYVINDSLIKVIEFDKVYPILKDEIVRNKSRCLVTYDGQK